MEKPGQSSSGGGHGEGLGPGVPVWVDVDTEEVIELSEGDITVLAPLFPPPPATTETRR